MDSLSSSNPSFLVRRNRPIVAFYAPGRTGARANAISEKLIPEIPFTPEISQTKEVSKYTRDSLLLTLSANGVPLLTGGSIFLMGGERRGGRGEGGGGRGEGRGGGTGDDGGEGGRRQIRFVRENGLTQNGRA